MPLLAAAPLAALITGGAGITGSLLANRQSDAQKAAQAAQTQNLTTQSDLAKTMAKIGGDQYALTQPAYGKAIDYYSSLLNGDRAKQLQAVQPDLARMTDIYAGSKQQILNTLRGPARDQAIAKLDQQHAEATGNLTGAPRQGAASTLLNLGASTSGSYLNALAGASGAAGGAAAGFGNQAATIYNQNQNSGSTWANTGADLAKLFGSYFLNPQNKNNGMTTPPASKYGYNPNIGWGNTPPVNTASTNFNRLFPSGGGW